MIISQKVFHVTQGLVLLIMEVFYIVEMCNIVKSFSPSVAALCTISYVRKTHQLPFLFFLSVTLPVAISIPFAADYRLLL